MTAGSFGDILSLLAGGNVKFILIGGLAGIAQGAARATVDVDVVYSRDSGNIQRLVATLSDASPYLRGVPPGLPFRFDEPTVSSGLNFTLTTTVGDLDLIGDVPGGGTYEELLPFTEELELFDVTMRCVTLERLIQLKRASGRPKDLEALSELIALMEERNDNAT